MDLFGLMYFENCLVICLFLIIIVVICMILLFFFGEFFVVFIFIIMNCCLFIKMDILIFVYDKSVICFVWKWSGKIVLFLKF